MAGFLFPLILLAVGLALGVGAGLTVAQRRIRSADARTVHAEREQGIAVATLEAERAATAQRIVDVRAEQERLTEQFQALAAQALHRNNEAFLTLADQRLRATQQTQAAELARRTTEVEQMVEPIKATLDKVAASITETDKSRVASHASLMEQVRLATETSHNLQTETRTLVRALQAPQTRGAWGEMQLRRVVELAGMLERVDFDTQVSRATDDGVLRPDLVIHVAGGKDIVVDAKVSLAAFLEASASDDPDVIATRRAAHARHLRDHVNKLAGKGYWRQFTTAPEFVVLFVPGESILVHALEADPALQEHAMEQQVIIATPTTLLTILRSVSYAWKQEQLTDHARAVFDLGRELYERLGTLGGHVDKLGRSISGVVRDYNAAVGSLETRVLSSARKLKELKFVDEELEQPKTLDQAMVRPLASPELALVAGSTEFPADQQPLDLDLELSSDARYGVDGREPAEITEPATPAGTLGA